MYRCARIGKMKDKENPNIEYKQISIPLVLVTILFIALVIMGICFVTMYFGSYLYGLIKGEDNLVKVILLGTLDAYLLYSSIINIVVVRRLLKMTADEHPIINQIFLYTSFNIPSGIMFSIIFKR